MNYILCIMEILPLTRLINILNLKYPCVIMWENSSWKIYNILLDKKINDLDFELNLNDKWFINKFDKYLFKKTLIELFQCNNNIIKSKNYTIEYNDNNVEFIYNLKENEFISLPRPLLNTTNNINFIFSLSKESKFPILKLWCKRK